MTINKLKDAGDRDRYRFVIDVSLSDTGALVSLGELRISLSQTNIEDLLNGLVSSKYYFSAIHREIDTVILEILVKGQYER